MTNLVKTSLTIFLLVFAISGQASAQNNFKGTVKDQNGDVVSGATVTVRNTQTGIGLTTTTNCDGSFMFQALPAGEYDLRVLASGFAVAEQTVNFDGSIGSDLVVTLAVGENRVTVSAEIGQKQEARDVPQAVTIIGTEAIAERATSVLAQAGEEEAGLNLQRTSPTIGAIVVRGLTGKNVVNFVDGVRYTNGAQRGGINTFFNLNEPTNLQSIEVLRGPNGAQYGSDSLAGTVNLITKSPVYGGNKSEVHGEFTPSFTSSDRSYGTSGLLSYGTRKFGGYVSFAGRRVGDLRTANGLDSHSAITRFLGLPSSILYDRNPDTGFQQYGGAVRLNFSPTDDQQIIFHYQRGQQDNGKRFDQLLGGDGNLIADLRNLMLDFGYLRYVKQGFGTFDSASFTVSYNSQREERVNQGGQGNPFGSVTHQYERTSTFGASFFLDKRIGRSNTFLVGGDYYAERVNSPAFIFDPVANSFTISRPRIPDGASFNSGGVFVQDQWDAIPERLRITGALRYSGAAYKVRAADAPIVGGQPLFPDDDLKTADFSGRIGAVVKVSKDFRIAFNYGRGFRYPNITDLGTLGLTGDGFEVDHITAGSLGGTIGTTAGADAVSTGLPVAKQRSEASNGYDFSVRYQRKRFDAEFTVFRLDIIDAITKQTLILPPGAVSQSLGGQTITDQLPTGAVFVALSTAPVLVRSNLTTANIWGIEFESEAQLRRDLVFKSNFTFIHAADSETGLPPNIEGGTPPPTGFLSLRYNHSRFWVEGYSTLAGRQDRFSSGDIADRRTGAPRSRSQIENFFRRGACVRGLTSNAAGTCNANVNTYTLLATGENITQVLTRVLGPGFVTQPLFTALPGYALANVRGGITINEKMGFFWAVENIFDQFYRNPSWGIDGPGRSFSAQFRYKF
ncbi:MAG: TonB-dependent receptor [Pyrinomonadaceae bacterium]